MTLWQAIVMGLIQGLTEFLPISSTAHLRVVPALLGWPDFGAAFTAVIQIGTLVAVLLYFRQDIARLVAAVIGDLRAGRLASTPDSRLAWQIAAGTVPVVILGLTLKKLIENEFRSLYVIGYAAIGMALLLAVAEGVHWWWVKRGRAGRELERITWADAIIIGLFQAIALVPGASRSGVTITGGLFCGLSRSTAARFSFLLSLPSVFAAGVYEFWKERPELLRTQEDAINLVVASVVAGAVGYASIAFLLGFLKKHSTTVFIVYRILLGVTLLILLARGVLQPSPPPEAHPSASNGYSAMVKPSDGISCNRRQPRVTLASSAATYSASIASFANGPSQITGGRAGSATYCASAGLQRMCRSGRRCSSSSGTSPRT